MVLTDILMEGIDGVEALEVIKKIQPNTRVYVMTAYPGDPRVKKAINLDAEEVFKKPFDVELLVEAFEMGVEK